MAMDVADLKRQTSMKNGLKLKGKPYFPGGGMVVADVAEKKD